jgi:hypothetical protein
MHQFKLNSLHEISSIFFTIEFKLCFLSLFFFWLNPNRIYFNLGNNVDWTNFLTLGCIFWIWRKLFCFTHRHLIWMCQRLKRPHSKPLLSLKWNIFWHRVEEGMRDFKRSVKTWVRIFVLFCIYRWGIFR